MASAAKHPPSHEAGHRSVGGARTHLHLQSHHARRAQAHALRASLGVDDTSSSFSKVSASNGFSSNAITFGARARGRRHRFVRARVGLVWRVKPMGGAAARGAAPAPAPAAGTIVVGVRELSQHLLGVLPAIRSQAPRLVVVRVRVAEDVGHIYLLVAIVGHGDAAVRTRAPRGARAETRPPAVSPGASLPTGGRGWAARTARRLPRRARRRRVPHPNAPHRQGRKS